MKIDKQTIDTLLHMYKPGARYISKANISFPNMKAKLKFPETPIYLVENLGIKHINNTEVELITNQAIFLFYRQALIEGKLNFKKISEENLKEYYNSMFIKQEIDYYEKFTERTKDLEIDFKHNNTRRIGSAYLVWCEMIIPKFLKANIVGGIELK